MFDRVTKMSKNFRQFLIGREYFVHEKPNSSIAKQYYLPKNRCMQESSACHLTMVENIEWSNRIVSDGQKMPTGAINFEFD